MQFVVNITSYVVYLYKISVMEISDPLVIYNTINNSNIRSLIEMTRQGIRFPVFSILVSRSLFNLSEWSSFLHISDRTMQRYKKENRSFDPPQSERIIEIALLFNRGTGVFGSPDQFNLWLETDNLALGKIKPKILLDSTFGIGLLNEELSRIEHGILP
jgi:putative toxin-antitoxin system antitoxin component (TIGR02293 family)